MCVLCNLKWLDDVMTFQIDVTTRVDDVTQHNHGNHGRLLLGRFIVNPNSWQETGNYYLFLTSNGTMNILKVSRQQLKVWHEYPTMTRTHALTPIAQSPTSIEHKLKILYLALLSIRAVGHLLWSYIDYGLCREQYSVTYIPLSDDKHQMV